MIRADMKKEALAVHRCRFVHHLQAPIVSLSLSAQNNLAVGRQNGQIQIYTAKQASLYYLHQTFGGSSSSGLEVVLYIGTRLFSAGLGGEIYEWDLIAGKVKKAYSSYGGGIWSMSVNKSQEVLAIGCDDGFIRLFRVESTGLLYLSALERQETKVLSIAWHPQKPIVAVGSTDGKVRVIHVDTGRTIHYLSLETTKGNETIVWDVLILVNGTIVTGDSNGKVSFFHGPTGTLIQQFKIHQADVLTLTCSADGTRVYSSGVDRKVVEYSKLKKWVHSGEKRYHTNDVRSMVYLESKPWDCLISGGIDTSLIFSSGVTDFAKMKQNRLNHSTVSPVSLSVGQRLMTCMFDESVKVWLLPVKANTIGYYDHQKVQQETHKLILTINCKGVSNLICTTISPNGQFIATSTSNQVKVFQIDAMQLPVTVSSFKTKRLDALEGASIILFTPDSSTMILAGIDGIIYVFDMETLQTSYTIKSFRAIKKMGIVTLMTISPDGLYLVVSDSNSLLMSFNLETKESFTLPTYPRATFIGFIPDSLDLVITTVESSVFIYNVAKHCLHPWSKVNSINLPTRFLQRKEVIGGACFPTKDKIMLFASGYIYSIDLHRNLERDTQWRLCHRFQEIIFAEASPVDGEVFLVERPVLQVLAELPEAFQKKRFGARR